MQGRIVFFRNDVSTFDNVDVTFAVGDAPSRSLLGAGLR
jgi:hypothetical protein